MGSRGEVLRRLFDLDERRSGREALAACPSLVLCTGEAAGSAAFAEAALVVVERGVVMLMVEADAAGRAIVVAIARRGALLAAPVGNAELRAIVDAELTVVTAEAQRELLRRPGAAAALVAAVRDAVRDREESLANFVRFPHVERVRGKLLQLARWHGKVTRAGVVIELPLTHELIAASIGSTRETVTLALRELARSGFVSRVGNRYRVNLSPEEVEGAGLVA